MAEKRLDWERVAKLAGFGGDESHAIFAELASAFMTAFPGSQSSLEEAIASGDAVRIRRAAHLLKGMCNNLGAFKLGALYERIENGAAAEKGKVTGKPFEKICQQAKSEFAELSQVIQHFPQKKAA